jgi:hypothetical protein
MSEHDQALDYFFINLGISCNDDDDEKNAVVNQ